MTELGVREFSESRFPNPVFSNPVFRIRLSGLNLVFRIRLPGPNPIPVFLIPFWNPVPPIRLSGPNPVFLIPFSKSDCPGRFCQRIKTRNCRVTDRQTHYVNLYIKLEGSCSEFIYRIRRKL